MKFQDVPVADLLKLVCEHFGVAVSVDPEVKGDIAFISLTNRTPAQAIEAIAHAADLQATVTADGYYIERSAPQSRRAKP